MALSYPIWAMLGMQQKKYIVILSQTQQLTKIILANIRKELEENERLISDFGPFRDADQWSANMLYVKGYNARIASISSGESIRGVRHAQNRPDLIICDDVEDLTSVKTKEGRDKVFNWLTGDVIPAGDKDTKVIIIGNLLHEDGLMMRLKDVTERGKFSGVYRQYPLLDTNGNPLWPEKFKEKKDIDSLKAKTASDTSWQREYLLRIVPDEDQVVRAEWIKYYDKDPGNNDNYRYIATGIDLAISLNDRADYTAMVSAKVYGNCDNLKVYILPHPINKRMGFPETVETIKGLSTTLGGGYHTELYIEEVGYQKALIEELNKDSIPAEGIKVSGQDKRSRLMLTTHLIKQGKVVFPKEGCQDLILQLTGFGYEKHDDLADAFSILILKIMGNDRPAPSVTWIDIEYDGLFG